MNSPTFTGNITNSVSIRNYFTFLDEGREVGKLEFSGGKLVFHGDMAESAKMFIECINNNLKAKA